MNINTHGKVESTCGACVATPDFSGLVGLENETISARFSPGEVRDALALARKICAGSGPVAAFLLSRLRVEEIAQLMNWGLSGGADGDEDQATGISILVRVLNSVLPLEELTRAGGPPTFLTEDPDTDPCRISRARVNRMLLEESFPAELHKQDWQQTRKVSSGGHAGEPWVAFTTEDRIGLALSGGGVRSATVNLGLLEALANKGLLNRFHYLATVSGGGYAGGFWTRWRKARQRDRRGPALLAQGFPQPLGAAVPVGNGEKAPREIREPREIRHLREFSRFLIPRSGFNAEFWAAAVAVLSGLVPSVLAAVAVVFGVTTTWALLAGGLLAGMLSPVTAGVVLAALAAGVLIAADRHARGDGEIEQTAGAKASYELWYARAMALALAAMIVAMAWMPAAGAPATTPPGPTPDFYRPSLALLWSLGALTTGQLLLVRYRRQKWQAGEDKGMVDPMPEAAWGRVMGRILAMLVVWAALAGLWQLAGSLVTDKGKALLSVDQFQLGGAAAAASLLFYLVRDWLQQPKVERRGQGVMDRVQSMMGSGGIGLVARLKPLVPRLLAGGVVVLLFLLAAVTLRLPPAEGTELAQLWQYWAGSAVVLALVLVLFDPAALGLHEFYRGRLSRCFLGAARVESAPEQGGRATADYNRVLIERADDDMRLCEDSGLPVHLVCCAANQATDDDHFCTLHRGARSAVLSRFGIALGNHWKPDTKLRLSSAMTASAAAFNSLMGERTLVQGRAVSFVMTALNLRLGLWVRNPAREGDSFWDRWDVPGVRFFQEMFALVQCRVDPRAGRHIHLSDGGHFENLALYELIRRHCRYIVVVDAGEDAQFAFDDLGRATRRVREDFGVEIEIDPAPLKPETHGRARQHLVVGVVHYDGVEGTDKGTLVYFKPTLSGDEPPDILQYQQRKPAFPHESTGDQFFDEAQFESYRRLGEHMVYASLGRLERLLIDPVSLPDESLFWRLRLVWGRRPPWLDQEAGVRLCAHAQALDEQLGSAATALHRWPFLGLGDWDHDDQICHEAMRAIQVCKFLEEAWVVCELDLNWSNPAAASWMSTLHRWAATPAVRDWWPAIKPLFGDGFQVFAERRLHLPIVPDPKLHARPQQRATTGGRVVPLADRRLQEVRPDYSNHGKCRQVFQLTLELPLSGKLRLQIGLAQIEEKERCAAWALDDLFIPPELKFGEYTSRLLDAVIAHYRSRQFDRLEVRLDDQELIGDRGGRRLGRDHAIRWMQTDLIDFYRSRGFRYDAQKWDGSGRCNGMVLRMADCVEVLDSQAGRARPVLSRAAHVLHFEPVGVEDLVPQHT